VSLFLFVRTFSIVRIQPSRYLGADDPKSGPVGHVVSGLECQQELQHVAAPTYQRYAGSMYASILELKSRAWLVMTILGELLAGCWSGMPRHAPQCSATG
jgi:hypothetical protein